MSLPDWGKCRGYSGLFLTWNLYREPANPCLTHTHTHTHIYIYIYIKVKLATVVEGYQNAPFSIATTPRYRGGRYSFPWIAPLPLIHTLYCGVLSKEASSTIFWVFRMTRPGIEPRAPGPLANTLTVMLMSGNIYIYRERERERETETETETGRE